MDISNENYVLADKVNHNQSFNDFKVSCEDVKVKIPHTLTESTNLPPSYDAKQKNRNEAMECVGVCLFIVLISGLFVGLAYYHQVQERDLYSFEKRNDYKVLMKTKKYGIEVYVKSGFNKKYPLGTPQRDKIEDSIVNDYIQTEMRYCSNEIWRRSINSDNTTPECDKLQNLGVHILQ